MSTDPSEVQGGGLEQSAENDAGDDHDSTIWVKTSLNPMTNSYFVEIEYDADRSRSVTPARAMAYAATVFQLAQQAEHDAAVFSQMILTLGIAEMEVARLIEDLRKDRPPLNTDVLKPLGLTPGVTIKGKPFLALLLDDVQVGQWSPTDAREHAAYLLECVQAADMDSAYFRMLTGVIGVEPARALNVISDLGKHRWAGDETSVTPPDVGHAE